MGCPAGKHISRLLARNWKQTLSKSLLEWEAKNRRLKRLTAAADSVTSRFQVLHSFLSMFDIIRLVSRCNRKVLLV